MTTNLSKNINIPKTTKTAPPIRGIIFKAFSYLESKIVNFDMNNAVSTNGIAMPIE